MWTSSLCLWLNFKGSSYVFFIFPLLCPQSTKAVYDRIIDLRIATPQIIINYAMFLEEHNYFEESFKVITCLFKTQTYFLFINNVHHESRTIVLTDAAFSFLGIWAWHCSLQVAQCVWHLEHLPHKVHWPLRGEKAGKSQRFIWTSPGWLPRQVCQKCVRIMLISFFTCAMCLCCIFSLKHLFHVLMILMFQQFTCCMPNWRRDTVWLDMPWLSTKEQQKQLKLRRDTTCSTSTSREQPKYTVSLIPEQFTRKQ